MTLIITACAALVATIAWYVRGRDQSLAALALMYWGASLMWSVDGFANLGKGEPFVELADGAQMVDDAILGLTVVVVGLAVWCAFLLVTRQHRTGAGASQ